VVEAPEGAETGQVSEVKKRAKPEGSPFFVIITPAPGGASKKSGNV